MELENKVSDDQITDITYNPPTDNVAQAGTNVINYNPIFPIMTASVELDLPIEDMATDILQMATDVENYEGGFTSLFTSLSLDNIKAHGQLQEAIYGVSSAFLKELKYDKNEDRCSIVTWANVMRTYGHHRPMNHPHTQLSGMFFVKCDDKSPPVVFDNPTNVFRMHELQIRDPNNYTPYTSPLFSLQPKPGTMLLWPSWMTYHIPKLSPNASVPFIFVSFTVDYLPPGV
jgi:uncharacterized protein (TIGR02466 family)